MLRDLGYFDLDDLNAFVLDGRYFVSRIPLSLKTFTDSEGREIDLWAKLPDQLGVAGGGDAHDARTRFEPYLNPLPIDAQTGQPSVNGVNISQYSALPTVLEISGVAVPSQQRTEWTSVKPAIKPGHMAS